MEKERVPATEIEWLHAKVEDFQKEISRYREALQKIGSYRYVDVYCGRIANEALMTRKERGCRTC